jgi:hypothetical protein
MRKWLIFLIVVLSWVSISSQLYLMLDHRIIPLSDTIILFFSYFTILTNLLVACYFTYQLLKIIRYGKLKVHQSNFLNYLVVYCIIVGVVYRFTLHHLWNPQGFQWIINEMLHTLIPILVFYYWVKFGHPAPLRLRNFIILLIFPLMYLMFVYWRGMLSGTYPYHFLDVKSNGLTLVSRNIILLTVSFIVIFYLLNLLHNKLKFRKS